MSKSLGKSRAGPGSRIPRPGSLAAASSVAISENNNNNLNTKNKKKRPRLATTSDKKFELPAPPLREKNDMLPPASVAPAAVVEEKQLELERRMVSGSSEFIRRNNKQASKAIRRSVVIGSSLERTMESPDWNVEDNLVVEPGKSSTPTADRDAVNFSFPKLPDTTFDLSRVEGPTVPQPLQRDGTFSKEDQRTGANTHDATFEAVAHCTLPVVHSESSRTHTGDTFTCDVKSEPLPNETFEFPARIDAPIESNPNDGTFCFKNEDSVQDSDVFVPLEKPKRPSSWTDCGPRTFILGAAGMFGKSLQGSPIGPYGSSKQSSIDQDDSLGILTPDQMDSLLVCTPPSSSQQQHHLDLRTFLLQQQSQKNDGSKSPVQSHSILMSRISPPHIDERDSLLILSNEIENENELAENAEELVTNISQPAWMTNTQLPATPSSEHTMQQFLMNLGSSPNFLDSTIIAASQGAKTLTPNCTLTSPQFLDEQTSRPGTAADVDQSQDTATVDSAEPNRQTLSLLLHRAAQHQNQQHQQLMLLSRGADMTPSPPEELPLDPVGVKLDVESMADEPQRLMPHGEQMSLAESESKSQSTSGGVSKTSNSFVASVTSITSLDNGYQGDGEMSRPVSRGAESHHLLHHGSPHVVGATAAATSLEPNQTAVGAVIGRPHHHARPDPMTDSDFFTESDADLGSSEDTAHRLARVIDGRLLYGHTAGNNNAGIATAGSVCLVEDSSSSCMESSGVYTDLENNSRAVSPPAAMSPPGSGGVMMKSATSSDSSAASPNAGNALRMPQHCEEEPMSMSVDESTDPIVVKTSNSSAKKPKPATKSSSPAHGTAPGKENKRPQVKRHNKWDSVMNKIAENKNKSGSPAQLREIKSKISTGIVRGGSTGKDVSRVRALGKVQCSSVQSLNERTANNSQQLLLKAKSRRTRVRASESNLLQADSQSDVSSAAGHTVTSSASSTIAGARRTTPPSVSSTASSPAQMRRASTPRKTTTAVAAAQTPNRAAKKRDVVRTSPARQNGGGVVAVAAVEVAATQHPLRHTKQGSPLRPTRPNTLLQKRGLSPASGASAPGTPGNGGNGLPAEPKVARKLLTPKRPLSSTKSAPLKEHNRLPVSQTGAGAAQSNNNGKSAVTPTSPAPLPSPVASIPEVPPHPTAAALAKGDGAADAARDLALLQKSARGVEALGVLVQYLVYNLDAFACPSLKRAQRATGISLLEARSNCARLEQKLADQVLRHARENAEKAQAQQLSTERSNEHIRSLESALAETKRDRDSAFERIAQLEQSQRALQEECERLRAEHTAERIELVGEIAFMRHTEQEKAAELAETRNKLEEQRNACDNERERFEEERSTLEQELRKLELALLELGNAKKSADYEADKWRTEVKSIRVEFENKVELLKQELDALRAKTFENDHHTTRTDKSVLLDEVESLRNVLELKQSELSDLRRRNLELARAADQLPATQAKAQTLEARVEDLQVQLQRKMDEEKELHQRNKLLEESFHQESKQKTRLSQYNEELQYRLKQNHEVVNVLAAMTGTNPDAAVLSPRKTAADYHLNNNNNSLHDTPTGFVRAHSRNGSTGGGRMSFNERYGSQDRSSLKLERKHSFREKQDKHRSPVMSSSVHNNASPSHPRLYDRHHSSPAHDSSGQSSDASFESKSNNRTQPDSCFEMEDLSPPPSPQIKAVVEKSDSVSWVLEIAEPPEMVANRLVRRAGSFRNNTPPPKKNYSSPSHHQNQQQSPPLLKRPRCNTGLTQRVALSSNEITRQNSDPTSVRARSQSVSSKLTRSASTGCAAVKNDSVIEDWSECGGSSTPYKSQPEENPRSYQNGSKDSHVLITCDTAALTSRCDELCPTLPLHRSFIAPDQRSDSPASSVSDDTDNSVDNCDKKSDENPMDGSWSEDGDTDI